MEINRENLLNLIREGLSSRDLSISALERHAGVAKDTVRDFLRGKTQVLRADKLQKVLKILSPDHRLRLAHYMDANAQILPIPPEQAESVELPPGGASEGMQALVIRSQAMEPVLPAGWVLYYLPHPHKTSASKEAPQGWHVPYAPNAPDRPHAAFLGKPAVIALKDGRLFLRTLRQGSAPHLFHLVAYQAPEIRDVEIDWLAKILFIKT